MIRGDRAPAALIVNLAGIRAPLGGGGELRAEPGAACFPAVVVAVEVVAGVAVLLVAGGAVARGAVAGGAVAGGAVAGGAVAVVRVVLDGLEPPQPASRNSGIRTRTGRRRFTLAA
jgi:hypothetical protein